MAFEKFIDHSFKAANRKKLNAIQDIIKEYKEKNLVLPLRQIHYQLVSKNITANTDSEYKKLSDLLSNARMSGVIDWNSIVDRNRAPHQAYYENDMSDSLWRTYRQYKLDRMRNQDVHVEIMIEKMAIFEIVANVSDYYSIMVTGNKGNCSDTILHDCSLRLIKACDDGKSCIVLYIGDHDPSGMMMVDNICERLSLLKVPDFEFRPIALTKEQALRYNLPPNDVKGQDTNSPAYIDKYGDVAWECDALPTDVLQDILRREIWSSIDLDKFEEMMAQEEREKQQLKVVIESMSNN